MRLARRLLLLFIILSGMAPALGQEEEQPSAAGQRAAVFLMQVYANQVISCVGEGTLVSPDGLILTNAHSAQSTERCRADAIVVALTIDEGEPPVPVYFADVVIIDRRLDLAVLRITQHLDGRRVQPNELILPFVELGDSNALALGDPVQVAGYPGIDNAAVETRAGTVSAFLSETGTGSRAWIKIDASIPGAMSGSGAYNTEGQLVGVPTIAPFSRAGQAVDCRVIQDTNGDGLIDTRDACVPIGGFISAMRPARLARPLVRAAQLGLRPGESRADRLPDTASTEPTGEPAFSRLFFAPSVNEAGQPTTVLAAASTGTERLYLFFDYVNMTESTVYELRTTIDGMPDSRFSLPPTTWSGGERGMWYVGIEGQVLSEGQYECQLFIEGQPAGKPARIEVGGTPQQPAMFTDLVFGMEGGGAGNLVGSGHVLPSGLSVVNAQFVYQNVSAELPWGARWYYEGAELSGARVEGPWTDPPGSGVKQVRIASEEGMRPGMYRLELYLGNRLAATGDFVIAGGHVGTGAAIFGPVTFSDATDAAGQADGTVGTNFPQSTERLYAFFDYQNMPPGVFWTQRWRIDEEIILDLRQPWSGPLNGSTWFISLDAGVSAGRLPDGTYQVELLVNRERVQTATATLGEGALKQSAVRSRGVRMMGEIVDAETGKGIPGALFVVLRAEFSVEDFLWDNEQILASSAADQRGHFEVPVQLAPDAYYSVVISAEGYLPVTADGIFVTEDTPDPLVMRLEMNRD